MKSILILTTPRTGSNLLLNSLACHPRAVTAGEVLSDDALSFNTEEAIQNIQSGTDWNLCKVLFSDIHKHEFNQIYHRCEFRLHLYRRDIVAQASSWVTACETGIWVNGQVRPNPCLPPMAPIEQISASRILLPALCDISICYETMIENWDATISYVLSCAQWEQYHLPMAWEKM